LTVNGSTLLLSFAIADKGTRFRQSRPAFWNRHDDRLAGTALQDHHEIHVRIGVAPPRSHEGELPAAFRVYH
jgi:hypothetical protein